MKPIYYLYTKALSDFSSRMQFIGLTSALLMSSYPELYMMLFFLGRQIGGMITSYLAGIVADRFSKHLTMIISELASGIAVLSLIFIEHPLFIVIVAFLLGITYTFFDVSFRASIPTMFSEESLTEINSLLVRLGATMSIVGFPAGGLISTFFSYKYLLVFDGLMYIGSAIVLLNIHWSEQAKSLQPVEQKQTLRNVLQSGMYMFLLAVGFVYPFAASAYQYALPLIASGEEYGDLYNGMMWSTVAVGSFLCSLIIKKQDVNERRYIVSLLLFGTFVSLTFIFDITLATFLVLLLVGAAEALVQVCHYTLLQRSEEHVRGRLFGLNTLATRCGFLAGFGVIPLLEKMTSLPHGIWLMQGMLVICCLVHMWRKYHS
ncbi:MFS transporter [Pseudalkalibacillus salsuginis]|uniref:MFS transporter n=1 Tax=Pseudalkalibacillus salsuginis TaxID=2910972 RepID=UPI001F3960A5|nr:MFS transporter [Pseudalkalibacillus salsuginis]MCF6409650.1 MFS transporter [Pseudalkalibacillus salsuginis]